MEKILQIWKAKPYLNHYEPPVKPIGNLIQTITGKNLGICNTVSELTILYFRSFEKNMHTYYLHQYHR